MEENFEIYFNDLTEEAKESFLKFLGIDSPEEGNFDTFPIALVPKGDPNE